MGLLQRSTAQLTLDLDTDVLPDATSTEPGTQRFEITPGGTTLLATESGSADEREVLGILLLDTQIVQRLGTELYLSSTSPTELGQRLAALTGLSETTALRRARTLLAWRAYCFPDASPSAPAQLHPPEALQTAAVESPEPPVGRIDDRLGDYLRSQVRQARLVLLLGAEAHAELLGLNPTKPAEDPALRTLLHDICFPGQPVSHEEQLTDLLSLASKRHPSALADRLRASRIGRAGEAAPFAETLRIPWLRAYTLHVSASAAEQIGRSAARGVLAVTGTTNTHVLQERPSAKHLAMLHLLGTLDDGTAVLRDSLPSPVPATHRAVLDAFLADAIASPLVLVGTHGDQDSLWQLLEQRGLRERRGVRELRPKAVLTSPKLSAARRALCSEYNTSWVPLGPTDFIAALAETVKADLNRGMKRLESQPGGAGDSPQVTSVATAIRSAVSSRSDYLRGAEPTWSDITNDRAATRDNDQLLLDTALEQLGSRDVEARGELPPLLITGTAGAGKSTALMRLAYKLSSEGYDVGHIGQRTEIDLHRWADREAPTSGYDVIALDGVERFGSHGPKLLQKVARRSNCLILCTTTSTRASIFQNADIWPKPGVVINAIPPLTDHDISRLLDALEREHKLGVLTGKTREYQEEAFRKRADRRLLVAMIEATSGQRFETKVESEWSELESADAQYVYIVIAAATSAGFSLTEGQLLRAYDPEQARVVHRHLVDLAEARILAEQGGRFRARHRVIADTLLRRITGKYTRIVEAYCDLVVAVSSGLENSSPDRHTRRALKNLVSYRRLFEFLTLDQCRRVYDTAEAYLHWNYHFWLQRGSLEVANGDIALAEEYLNQAKGLNEHDNLVQTEYAYMQIRKSLASPGSHESSQRVSEAMTTLRRQTRVRGTSNYHPFHIIGAQGLAWSRHGSLPTRERLDFLKEVASDIDVGISHHPDNRELRDIRRDVQREILRLKAGLSG